MATEIRLIVLDPAPSPDDDGLTWGGVIADLTPGYDFLAPSGQNRSLPGPSVHVDDLIDGDDDRRMFFYDAAEVRVVDDGRGSDLRPLDVGRLTAALGRMTRGRNTDKVTAAHRYLRALRDDMAGDLRRAVVVARFL